MSKSAKECSSLSRYLNNVSICACGSKRAWNESLIVPVKFAPCLQVIIMMLPFPCCLQMAAAIRAASTEALGAESPCRVKLRVWRISNKRSQLRRVSSESQPAAQRASAASPSASGAPAPPEQHEASGSSCNGEGGITLESVLLTIPDAVLCSEMGVHLSPCGRYLAACIVCMQVIFSPARIWHDLIGTLNPSLGNGMLNMLLPALFL